MLLIVGLGNPGAKYQGTRHNIGFQILDYLSENNNFTFSPSKWLAQTAKAEIWGERLLFVKPETFMNESGQAVERIASYFHIAAPDIIVIHDDLDLDLGRVKVVNNRGSGGHRGISSIINHLHSREFSRIRVGIGRPPAPMAVTDFVLGRFAAAERQILSVRIPQIEAALKLIVKKGPLAAMAMINQRQTQELE
ncbi:Peptidyl-tRNA hydrolase [hydrothermal vent metagenome]|uniref:peptidyl-tRNA hydrolase n=1 Tax=hydrothermal vent metagenome TaxID=652676 RepID=A0A3B0UZ97_9ZZZZ